MFRQFWLIIFIRLVLIALSSGLSAFFWLGDGYPINKWLWVGICLLITADTCRYIYKIIDAVDHYLKGFSQSDFSAIPFSYQKWGKLKELRKSLKELNDKSRFIKKTSTEDAEKYAATIDIAPVGILAWNDEGEMLLFNSYAKDLLKIEGVTNTRRLNKLRPILFKQLEKLSAGYAGILKYSSDGNEVKIGARKSELKIGQEHFTMVVLQSLEKEIENVESDAWERLMKIMTHEIMNSITSVHSLSSTLSSLLEQKDLENSLRAANSIQNRSLGLLRFVQDYRTLSEIPSPNAQDIELRTYVDEFIQEVERINPSINIQTNIARGNKVLADPQQLSLVLTNLYLNSTHALDNIPNPEIMISSQLAEDGIELCLSDNGRGMDKNTLENAFIPFYTTRTNGSGIGLPLSRQILRAMGGRLTIQSEINKGTKAYIYLPKV